jgi:hypothetical protein
MLKGVALGFLTYGLFSSADALIIGLGGELPVTEIVLATSPRSSSSSSSAPAASAGATCFG